MTVSIALHYKVMPKRIIGIIAYYYIFDRHKARSSVTN